MHIQGSHCATSRRAVDLSDADWNNRTGQCTCPVKLKLHTYICTVQPLAVALTVAAELWISRCYPSTEVSVLSRLQPEWFWWGEILHPWCGLTYCSLPKPRGQGTVSYALSREKDTSQMCTGSSAWTVRGEEGEREEEKGSVTFNDPQKPLSWPLSFHIHTQQHSLATSFTGLGAEGLVEMAQAPQGNVGESE